MKKYIFVILLLSLFIIPSFKPSASTYDDLFLSNSSEIDNTSIFSQFFHNESILDYPMKLSNGNYVSFKSVLKTLENNNYKCFGAHAKNWNSVFDTQMSSASSYMHCVPIDNLKFELITTTSGRTFYTWLTNDSLLVSDLDGYNKYFINSIEFNFTNHDDTSLNIRGMWQYYEHESSGNYAELDSNFNNYYWFSNFELLDYYTNQPISIYSDFSTKPITFDSYIDISPGESIMIQDKGSSGNFPYNINGYYYLEFIHYNNDFSSFESLSNSSNIPNSSSELNDSSYGSTSYLRYTSDKLYPYYVYYLYNRDSKTIRFEYNKSDLDVRLFMVGSGESYDFSSDNKKYIYKNLNDYLSGNATLNFGSTNGKDINTASSSNPFSSITNLLGTIPDIIRTFGAVFAVIGTLFTIFFSTMPIYISTGLYAIFFISLIVLVIKSLK